MMQYQGGRPERSSAIVGRWDGLLSAFLACDSWGLGIETGPRPRGSCGPLHRGTAHPQRHTRDYRVDIDLARHWKRARTDAGRRYALPFPHGSRAQGAICSAAMWHSRASQRPESRQLLLASAVQLRWRPMSIGRAITAQFNLASWMSG
jgi:hypothetical protein